MVDEENKVSRASSMCICAEVDGKKIYAEQCGGLMATIRNLGHASVDVEGKCDDIRFPLGTRGLGRNTISGSGCNVNIEGKDYHIDRYTILRGGKC